MDMQDHVSGIIADGRIRIGQGVVEEPNDLVVVLLRGSSFLCGNGSECNDHGGIHGNGILQLGANDFLYAVDGFRRKAGGVIRAVSVLDGCAVNWIFQELPPQTPSAS